MPSLRLESPGLEPLEMSAGWVVQDLNVGAPEVAEALYDVPSGDGSIDKTQFVRARDVILVGHMFADDAPLWVMQDRLNAFLSPRRRVDLVFQQADDAPVKVLRGASGRPQPWSVVDRDDSPFRAVWRVPSGVIESAVLHEAQVFPGSGDGQDGIEFDVEFVVEFPAAPPPGTHTVVNGGNFDAYPVFRIFGPCGGAGNDPIRVSNLTTGLTLALDDIEVQAGEFLEVDTRAKTIRLNGLASQSRYSKLVFPVSQWWTLVPGVNLLAFRPDTFSGSSQLVVHWRSAWL